MLCRNPTGHLVIMDVPFMSAENLANSIRLSIAQDLYCATRRIYPIHRVVDVQSRLTEPLTKSGAYLLA